MFDSIVPGYDFLNSFLSLGFDRLWRRRLIKEAGNIKEKNVLDLCSGTGALALNLLQAGSEPVALDFSLPMLKKGMKNGSLGNMPVASDASVMPFRDSVFDLQTIAFGIRNIPDIERFLSESRRTLKSGGRLMILELTRPENPGVRALYNIYLKGILPVIGGIFSGNFKAYRYLARTISGFTDPKELKSMILNAGFSKVEVYPLTFGVATLIVSE